MRNSRASEWTAERRNLAKWPAISRDGYLACYLRFTEGAFTVLLFIVIWAGVLVGLTPFEQEVDNAGEFMGRGGDGFGSAELGAFAAIEGAEGGVGTNHGGGGLFEGLAGAVISFEGVGTEDFAAGDVVMRGEAEPGSEVFDGGPAGHIGADFG